MIVLPLPRTWRLTALGVLLGWAGAQFSVRAVGQTVNALYYATTVASATPSVTEVALGLGLGLVASLAAGAWPVVVVLGAHAEKIRPTLARLPVLVAENAAWPEGMAASIRTGITTLGQFSRTLDAALLALCDQPAFSAPVIAQLLAAQRASGRSIVAARYASRHGAPALLLREHFPALAALTGEAGARDLLNGTPDRVAAVDLPALAHDLDTPADYAAVTKPA